MKQILLMLLMMISMSSRTQIKIDTTSHKIELNLQKQKPKFFHKADIAIYSLFFLGGAAEGFNDALWGHNPYPGNRFFDPQVSWKNKYTSDVPFAKNLMVWTTDADHLSSFVADLFHDNRRSHFRRYMRGRFQRINQKAKGSICFKNGLPIAYAGSWILFDSSRIGLNVFPAYRGGESQYIFEQVLKLHQEVYKLNRFSVDPYQIGKENSEGIKSGAFWTYYRSGFRPIREEQKRLAEAERLKIKSTRGYRSPASVLNKLADSRLEVILQKSAVRFDATDLSLTYANILKNRYNNNRKAAEELSFTKLIDIIQLKNYHEEKLKFILKNWCVLLLTNEPELRRNNRLKKILKKLFELKASGDEEDYIAELQRASELRKFLKRIVKENIG